MIAPPAASTIDLVDRCIIVSSFVRAASRCSACIVNGIGGAWFPGGSLIPRPATARSHVCGCRIGRRWRAARAMAWSGYRRRQRRHPGDRGRGDDRNPSNAAGSSGPARREPALSRCPVSPSLRRMAGARGSARFFSFPRKACFRHGNGLLSARHLFARAASQRAHLLLVHDSFDFSLLPQRFHGSIPDVLASENAIAGITRVDARGSAQPCPPLCVCRRFSG